jgi:hypothetical protein
MAAGRCIPLRKMGASKIACLAKEKIRIRSVEDSILLQLPRAAGKFES